MILVVKRMITLSNNLAYQLTIVLHVFLLVGVHVEHMEEHQQKYHMLLYLCQYVVGGVKLNNNPLLQYLSVILDLSVHIHLLDTYSSIHCLSLCILQLGTYSSIYC